jgi:hypothetical protein
MNRSIKLFIPDLNQIRLHKKVSSNFFLGIITIFDKSEVIPLEKNTYNLLYVHLPSVCHSYTSRFVRIDICFTAKLTFKKKYNTNYSINRSLDRENHVLFPHKLIFFTITNGKFNNGSKAEIIIWRL